MWPKMEFTAMSGILSPTNSFVEALTQVWWYLKMGPLGVIRGTCGYKGETFMMGSVPL